MLEAIHPVPQAMPFHYIMEEPTKSNIQVLISLTIVSPLSLTMEAIKEPLVCMADLEERESQSLSIVPLVMAVRIVA